MTNTMSYKNIIFFVIFCFVNKHLCDTDVLTDFLEKCSIRDGECQKDTLTFFIQAIAEGGLAELDIPPLEPYQVKDTTISILNMVDLTMTEGQVEGPTNCSFVKFETNFEKRYTYIESFCDFIKMSGHYKIEVGPLTQALLGNPVSGDGFGIIQIEKMMLKMKVPFSIDEINGVIHLVPNTKEADYSTYDIENISFAADNIVFGGREISEPLMKFMNKNWKRIYTSFGRFFSDQVMKTFFSYMKTFFLNIPASALVSDDLSSDIDNKY